MMAPPADVGVDQVLHVSPSFLLKKPGGTETGHRFITAFNELTQYTRTQPTVSRSYDEVIRKLAPFKFIIKCDLAKSFYQIPVTKKSIPFLGTTTPFKGLRVYLVAAMGQPGSSEALEELISKVFGDFIYEGWFIHIHDGVNVLTPSHSCIPIGYEFYNASWKVSLDSRRAKLLFALKKLLS